MIKAMRRKYRSVFQDHLKYICNEIVKKFRVIIIHYAERVQDTHDSAKHLRPPSMKGNGYESANWKVHDKNYLLMIFKLLLRADYPHTCRMSWSIIKRTIVPWLMNIGVTSCLQPRPKIIDK